VERAIEQKKWKTLSPVRTGRTGNVVQLDAVVRNGIDQRRLEEDPKAVLLGAQFIDGPAKKKSEANPPNEQ
jgi:hypothetical protein